MATFGETRVPYLADTEHLNRLDSLYIDGDNIYVVEEQGNRVPRFSTAGQVTLALGRAGVCAAEDYAFCIPRDIAVDANGDFWAVDGYGHRVVQYGPDGTFRQQFPSRSEGSGSDTGRFNFPSGIAFDSAGRMFVADANNHRVQVFDMSAGAPVHEATIGAGTARSGSTQFDAPGRFAIDGSDHLFVADFGNDRVQRCTETASAWTCSTLDAGLNNPDGIAVDQQNNVFIADQDNFRIRKCSAAGVCSTWAANPPGLQIWPSDSSGNVYGAANYERLVVKFNAAGTQSSVFAGVQRESYLTDGSHYNQPRDVAVDSAGNMVIIEENGHRLIKLNAAGSVQWTIGDPGKYGSENTQLRWPRHLAQQRRRCEPRRADHVSRSTVCVCQ